MKRRFELKVITNSVIQALNRLYIDLKTYAAVARATGFSPATVKKYVIKDYKVVDENNIIRFNKPLPDLDSTMFRCDDWGHLCLLSEDEINEIKILWKELEV